MLPLRASRPPRRASFGTNTRRSSTRPRRRRVGFISGVKAAKCRWLDEVGSHLHFAAFTPEINPTLLRLGLVDDLLVLVPNDARLGGLEALSGSIHLGEN